MDGKGCWIDNMFVERLWRSVKCQFVYLHARDSLRALQVAPGEYVELFDAARPHQSLGYRTPDELYIGFSDNALIQPATRPSWTHGAVS
jgi:putative transposase